MSELNQPCVTTVAVAQGVLADPDVERFTTILKALAHPVRLRMVDLIRQGGGDVCVCEFEKHFELKQPTISHHLRILREAGLIRSRQDGTWVRHTIDGKVFALAQQLLASLAGDLEPA
ncbi:MAG: metalloregulator ArsR/SmtB family transcription factor [Rhodothermales bacterium]